MKKLGNNFSLSFLFLVLTLCGIVAGLISAIIPREGESYISVDYPLAVVACMIIGCMIAGLIIGAHHHRRSVGVGIGFAAGILAGLALAPMCFAPASAAGRMLIIQLGGGVLLVVLAASLRLLERDKVDDTLVADSPFDDLPDEPDRNGN